MDSALGKMHEGGFACGKQWAWEWRDFAFAEVEHEVLPRGRCVVVCGRGGVFAAAVNTRGDLDAR